MACSWMGEGPRRPDAQALDFIGLTFGPAIFLARNAREAFHQLERSRAFKRIDGNVIKA
jgi:hypothetical protein